MPKPANLGCTVYIICKKDGKYLMMERQNTSHMNDLYCLPAGKLDEGEPMTIGAARELAEEVGIVTKPESLKCIHVMHKHKSSSHSNVPLIEMFFECKNWQGEPKNMEPHKHGDPVWLKLGDKKLVPYVQSALEHIENGVNYSEFAWENK